jgi:hypothetical protein
VLVALQLSRLALHRPRAPPRRSLFYNSLLCQNSLPGLTGPVLNRGENACLQGEVLQYKAGQAIQVPPETPHAGGKPPAENVHLMTNYIVEKGKPLIKFV